MQNTRKETNMNVTLGGDRLGSGNKNKIALHNYERSTHNLTQKFTSSLQCGTLYPFLIIPAMRGDKFNIKLEADARTIPTKGPLFGSFKMQLDLFQCDVRLYQAILHNNPLAIGLKMNQVMFPQLVVRDKHDTVPFSNSSLLKYLGMSGIGTDIANQSVVHRRINAIPALAYYEIFKTYYSNKQEENAYIIGTESGKDETLDKEFVFYNNESEEEETFEIKNYNARFASLMPYNPELGMTIEPANGNNVKENWEKAIAINYIYYDREYNYTILSETLEDEINKEIGGVKITKINNNKYLIQGQPITPSIYTGKCNRISFTTPWNNENGEYTFDKRGLQPFSLANIDDMRLKLLSWHELGRPFSISLNDAPFDENGTWDQTSGTDQTGLPYINLVNFTTDENHTRNADPLNGLVVKTYQSDLYNCWVNTEWIDGENGIANVTAISTASGSIKIDSLNLAEKLYNMLNRIAVSDGSYEGWQDAVYTETPKRHIESPIYLGGMSSEVVFEEIVQSAPAEGSALGTLGGKGKLMIRKGGHVTVKTNEAAFIIGIVSLTPRINYTQGNEFYMTDLMSMDDYHKPALDGIGFQDLIAERAAWWDTRLYSGGVESRRSLGKVPAWIEYMTAVDKAYGDFAEKEGFMSLNRDYTRSSDNLIEDATTYIDPRKYNYAFAYTDIDAQNFWVQIKTNITGRRLMSAKQIPNI